MNFVMFFECPKLKFFRHVCALLWFEFDSFPHFLQLFHRSTLLTLSFVSFFIIRLFCENHCVFDYARQRCHSANAQCKVWVKRTSNMRISVLKFSVTTSSSSSVCAIQFPLRWRWWFMFCCVFFLPFVHSFIRLFDAYKREAVSCKRPIVRASEWVFVMFGVRVYEHISYAE